MLGLYGRELITPPYTIRNPAGGLSNKTLDTDLDSLQRTYRVLHSQLVRHHDVFSFTQRSSQPLVITRSTFLGAGAHVGHWTGDDVSNWAEYLISISDMLNFGINLPDTHGWLW